MTQEHEVIEAMARAMDPHYDYRPKRQGPLEGKHIQEDVRSEAKAAAKVLLEHMIKRHVHGAARVCMRETAQDLGIELEDE